MDYFFVGMLALLSFVLVASGGSKLPAHTSTVDAMTSLRIPVPALHRTAAYALPVGELALAVGIWLPWTSAAVTAAVLVTALFALFTLIIGRALRFEEPVTCSCFGSFGAPAVTVRTLVRNIVLTAAGVVGIIGAAGGASPGVFLAATPGLTLSAVALVLVAAGVTWLVVGEGTADGTRAGAVPEISYEEEFEDYLPSPIPFGQLRNAEDRLVSLSSLVQQRARLLVFLSPGCGPCIRIMEKMEGFRAQLDPVVALDAVFSQSIEALAPKARETLGETVWESVWEDPERNVASAFQIQGRPAAVLLGADGTVAGGPVSGESRVEDLIEEMRTQLHEEGLLTE